MTAYLVAVYLHEPFVFPEKITLSVIAVRCQLSRKGELFAFYGKHKESSPFRGSWMRTK